MLIEMEKISKEDTAETNDLIVELVQNKCINPPGDELRSIKTIEKFLEAKGIECKVYESAQKRGNLTAVIKGSDPNHPGLIFGPSHVDVVPVTKPEEWSIDPFSGEIKDDYIWGRGTLDMLFMVATQVQAFAKLHSEQFKPKGDLVLFIVADEECGGDYGTKYVVDKHPEELGFKKRRMFAVTESGGFSIAPNKFIFISGEKGAFLKVLKFKGTPGHGSMPYDADNAVLKASKAALLLNRYCEKKIPLETKYLRNLAKGMKMNFFTSFLLSNKKLLPFAIRILKKSDPSMAKFIHSISRMTISPNMVEGGTKTNIIASTAQLNLDIRTLPGQDNKYVLHHLKKALGKLSKEVEITEFEGEGIVSLGSESPVNSEFVNAMQRAIQLEFSEASLVPLISMTATDGRFLREQGVDTYGFALYNPDKPLNEFLNLVHGVNERVDLKTVELSLKVYYNLAHEFLDE